MAEAYRLKGDFALDDLINMAFWRTVQGAEMLLTQPLG